MGVATHRGGPGILEAVVQSPYPQHVLHAVVELREAVELAVTEVNGSLGGHKQHQTSRMSWSTATRNTSTVHTHSTKQDRCTV